MAPTIHNGRFTTANDEEIVLFLLGIRVNKVRAVRSWLPVVRALKPMLRELSYAPDSGLLYSRTQRYGWREVTLLQYWRSTDALLEFSHAAMHRRAWRDFYKVAARGTDVGLWHETYVVPAGRYESIYGSVPRLGLAVAHGLTPIGRRTDSARARLDATIPTRRPRTSRAGRQNTPATTGPGGPGTTLPSGPETSGLDGIGSTGPGGLTATGTSGAEANGSAGTAANSTRAVAWAICSGVA